MKIWINWHQLGVAQSASFHHNYYRMAIEKVLQAFTAQHRVEDSHELPAQARAGVYLMTITVLTQNSLPELLKGSHP